MIVIVAQFINLLIPHAIIMLLMVLSFLFIGRRFLDFPEKKYCCFCCDSAHGCGIVSPDWIAKSNATYQGT